MEAFHVAKRLQENHLKYLHVTKCGKKLVLKQLSRTKRYIQDKSNCGEGFFVCLKLVLLGGLFILGFYLKKCKNRQYLIHFKRQSTCVMHFGQVQETRTLKKAYLYITEMYFFISTTQYLQLLSTGNPSSTLLSCNWNSISSVLKAMAELQ